MALSEEEREHIRTDVGKRADKMTIEQIMAEMSRLEERVDKRGGDAFLCGLYVFGGGFFMIGKYALGVANFIIGYGVLAYALWLAVSSALSYFFDFERCWKLCGVVMILNILIGLAGAIASAMMASDVRERALLSLEVLKQKCKAAGGS